MYKKLKKYSEDKDKKIYLFGAGKISQKLTDAFNLFGIRIDGYFDNKLKLGGELNGFKILPLENLINAIQENTIVVIASTYEYEMTKQLKEYGYSDNIIYMRRLAMELYEKYDVLEFPIVQKPLVSVLITAYNEWDFTYNCLKSLLENGNLCEYEVIIGDNCSTDETKSIEKYIKNVKVVHHQNNLQYLGNANAIAQIAGGKYIMLLSNDTYFCQKGYLDKLVKTIELSESIAAVSGKFWIPASGKYDMPRNYIPELYEPNDCKKSLGEPISDNGKIRNVEFLWPVATLYRKKVWDEIGGFDKHFLPAFAEDCDLNLRIINSGYSLVFNPELEIIHYGGGTYNISVDKVEMVKNSRTKFDQRWNSYINNFDKKRMAYINTVYN